MKPFLILQLRPIDAASDSEYQAFLKYGNLRENEVHRVRMEKIGIPEINLEDYSAVIVGGGPANVSDPENKKGDEQKKYESELALLFDKIIENDFPFLGACYGLGAVVKHLQCEVSKDKYSEDVGVIGIHLTDNAENDPLTIGLPNKFNALGGHKESCISLPANAVLLASSKDCPNQIIRIKNNIYATQFHLELDQDGLALRINIYKNAGYFPSEDVDKLINRAKGHEISIPMIILHRFVQRYKQ